MRVNRREKRPVKSVKVLSRTAVLIAVWSDRSTKCMDSRKIRRRIVTEASLYLWLFRLISRMNNPIVIATFSIVSQFLRLIIFGENEWGSYTAMRRHTLVNRVSEKYLSMPIKEWCRTDKHLYWTNNAPFGDCSNRWDREIDLWWSYKRIYKLKRVKFYR
jgi:hypothetical protein